MEKIEIMPVRVRITSILKKALISGEYKNGDELSLTEIATRLGVSRTPVREAFQTLAAEGLIELRMNKGAIVKLIDERFIIDHYEMRLLLECEAAARAAKNGMSTDVLLNKLHEIENILDTISQEDYEKINLDIHTSIWTAANNHKLYNYLSNLWNGPSTGFANSKIEHYQKSNTEHIKILEFIKLHDEKSAREAMSEHIIRSMNNIIKSFQSSNQPAK
ncbi:GntR family transcriptional regulator [Fusobacterium sp. PH5-44]|uniref:GntR family transcriptional regulator n=1 Tax=unclassified Fusobacterium TaxID=2648384 RepID=UPI003D21FB2D